MVVIVKYILKDISVEEVNKIKNLWEQLNKMHLDKSPYFKEHYRNQIFEDRIKVWSKYKNENFLITIIEDDLNKEALGYCISGIDDNGIGEIESIYIEQMIRGQGLGEELINRHINWLKSKESKKIKLAVSYGNEAVLRFYMKAGLFPRLTYMEFKDK